jgi:hypothetical protein
VLRNRLHQDAALCLQPAGDDILQLRHLGASRVKQRELSADFPSWDLGPEGAEAKGYKCGLGLAQEVPDFLCLTHTNNLEVLQLFLGCSQLLHLLLGQ